MSLEKQIEQELKRAKKEGEAELIARINELRAAIHKYSPFADEPVDFVRWEPNEKVQGNDYNPNSVAPPEMELLATSIRADGYTQPIVVHQVGKTYEVVDGFHRNRVGKESKDIVQRVRGHLPLVVIKATRTDKADRIAATIRHNRARGKHRVQAMSDIVIELKNRNWKNARIAKELGMDEDEILRLCQITGLANIFADQDFSRAWEIEDSEQAEDFGENALHGDDVEEYRTVNTDDPDRIFHPFGKWECHKAGLYATSVDGKTKEECEKLYAEFLSDLPRFEKAAKKVISTWKNSCEHYLTNTAMNRIAWIGQAAACYATGLPNSFSAGFYLLSERQQAAANTCALKILNVWLKKNKRSPVTMEQAAPSRQVELY